MSADNSFLKHTSFYYELDMRLQHRQQLMLWFISQYRLLPCSGVIFVCACMCVCVETCINNGRTNSWSWTIA